jgi:hypothetical protein
MFLRSWSVSFSESWVSSRRDRLVGVLGAVSVLSEQQSTLHSMFTRVYGMACTIESIFFILKVKILAS